MKMAATYDLTGKAALVTGASRGNGLLTARLMGYDAIGLQTDPFLLFAARAKTRAYANLPELRRQITGLLERAAADLDRLDSDGDMQWKLAGEVPAMPRLQTWLSGRVVWKVLALRHSIEECVGEEYRDLPMLALAAALRGASHMKLSPHAYGSRETKQFAPVLYHFDAKLRKMLSDLEWLGTQEEIGSVSVLNRDIRYGAATLPENLATIAIASPPSLEDADPTVRTRLELFFLGHVGNMEELNTLRERLSFHGEEPSDAEPKSQSGQTATLRDVVQAINEKHGKESGDVTGYFTSLTRALHNTREMLAPGSPLIISVRESVHKGVYVPTLNIVTELGREIGYLVEDTKVTHTRRHPARKGGLKEFVVVMRA